MENSKWPQKKSVRLIIASVLMVVIFLLFFLSYM